MRARREATRPEQVGLPAGRGRRTPGLRREEVALLAGVSFTWYTWLEQGRQINASHDVLLAIGRALQLDEAEQEHLIALTDPLAPPEHRGGQVTEEKVGPLSVSYAKSAPPGRSFPYIDLLLSGLVAPAVATTLVERS